jgi:ribosomal-protein-alanine N-acetyltransferase
MNINRLTFKEKTASHNDIYAHLMSCNSRFIPPLSKKVNIQDYSKKLFERSITFEAWANESMVGLVAVYFDEIKEGTGFITNVSVLENYTGSGLSERLLVMCLEWLRKKDISSVKLEVSRENIPAIKFYEKLGFKEEKTNSESIFMVYCLYDIT